MSETVMKFDSWEEVICDFINNRKNEKIIKLLSKKDPKLSPDNEKQAIITQLEHALKDTVVSNEANKVLLKKNTGPSKVSKIEFVTWQYQQLVALKPNLPLVHQISTSFYEKRQVIEGEHTPADWLDKYAKFANGVSFASHVAKLTHSSIKGATSFFVNSDALGGNAYLSTSSLASPVIDSAIDNAAYTPVINLLKLEIERKKLADFLLSNDPLPFRKLASNKDQLAIWMQEFSYALSAPKLSSHSLAKQIYFPTCTKSFEYHLLCNVNSSSLSHMIFEYTSKNKNKNKNENQNKAKVKNKYHKGAINYFPGRATLSLTSLDSAKNVSPLHSKRGGKLYLLSCQPSTWHSQLKPPINRKSLFDAVYNSSVTTEMDYIRDFLLRFKRLELSIKDPKRKQHLVRWVDNIIDECLFYIASIQNLPAGWTGSDNIRLKPEHQFLLDPYRVDDMFQKNRQSTDWQTVIVADFAQWMNIQLRGNDKQFTPQAEHTRFWKKQFEQPLREHMEPIEQETKQAMKESV